MFGFGYGKLHYTMIALIEGSDNLMLSCSVSVVRDNLDTYRVGKEGNNISNHATVIEHDIWLIWLACTTLYAIILATSEVYFQFKNTMDSWL